MKRRPDGFLRPEVVDHDSEVFDYIAELHAYLWRFVRVADPSACGSLSEHVDAAVAKLEGGVK